MTTPTEARIECAHGSLRRSCEICERDERIAQLELELAEGHAYLQRARCIVESLEAKATKAEQARDVLAEALRSLAATQPKRVDETAFGCRLCNRIIRTAADHFDCPVTLAKDALTKAGVER